MKSSFEILRISSWFATSGKICRAYALAMLYSSVHCMASAMANIPKQLLAVSCFSKRNKGKKKQQVRIMKSKIHILIEMMKKVSATNKLPTLINCKELIRSSTLGYYRSGVSSTKISLSNNGTRLGGRNAPSEFAFPVSLHKALGKPTDITASGASQGMGTQPSDCRYCFHLQRCFKKQQRCKWQCRHLRINANSTKDISEDAAVALW